MIDTLGAPYKVAILLEKYERHRTPADGEPDDVVASAQWHEADGTPVTDPARIAELEERIRTMANRHDEARDEQVEVLAFPLTKEQESWPNGTNPTPATETGPHLDRAADDKEQE